MTRHSREIVPRVAIITSVTDGYDTLKRIKPQIGTTVEWLAITDGSEKAEENHGWEIIDIRDRALTTDGDLGHPNRLAKIPKCLPWAFTAAPFSIWIDASYRVTSSLFAVQAMACAHPVSQFVHPWRDCIYQEAVESLGLPKYADTAEAINAQKNEYQAIGHPENWGLWATGVIARQHTRDVKIMGQEWLREIRRHSYQDQISEPVALRFCDLRPTPLPGDHLNNPWLSYEGSARH
jgi:hypothetical protein